jgi:hypothetical protein
VAEEEPVTEQELRDALSRLQISDLLVQSLSTVSSLAFHRLAPESRDLEQARLAIEALRALVPVLRETLPAELTRDFESVTANLQLAYAKAVEEERRGAQPEEQRRPEKEQPEPPSAA